MLCNVHLSTSSWAVPTTSPCIVDIPLGHFHACRCISHLLQRLLLLGSCGLVLYTHLMNVFNHEYLSLWCPYLCQLEKIWHHAALTCYCSVPYFWLLQGPVWWSKGPLTLLRSMLRLLTLEVWSWWHLSYARCVAVVLQRADLGPLLSWFVATTVMDLLCEECWVARS